MADIFINDVRKKYPDILEILLVDHTTKKNIIWATEHYVQFGKRFDYNSHISPKLITGNNGNVILPRVCKNKAIQRVRVRNMAEVFTPSWLCNSQNNLIDKIWFGYNDVFNTEHINGDGVHSWETNNKRISFPQDKTWQNYIQDLRLEIACGEAPYIASRYDTTTGHFIQVENRIGLLDRKLRIINENVEKKKEWYEAVKTAFKSIYAFEWQGDSLYLAREAMLITFIENHRREFHKDPNLTSLKEIAKIIAWNVWQMDGLKGVTPNSCFDKNEEMQDIFVGSQHIVTHCEGCSKNNIFKHNGTYCVIMDWAKRKKIKFISLLK